MSLNVKIVYKGQNYITELKPTSELLNDIIARCDKVTGGEKYNIFLKDVNGEHYALLTDSIGPLIRQKESFNKQGLWYDNELVVCSHGEKPEDTRFSVPKNKTDGGERRTSKRKLIGIPLGDMGDYTYFKRGLYDGLRKIELEDTLSRLEDAFLQKKSQSTTPEDYQAMYKKAMKNVAQATSSLEQEIPAGQLPTLLPPEYIRLLSNDFEINRIMGRHTPNVGALRTNNSTASLPTVPNLIGTRIYPERPRPVFYSTNYSDNVAILEAERKAQLAVRERAREIQKNMMKESGGHMPNVGGQPANLGVDKSTATLPFVPTLSGRRLGPERTGLNPSSFPICLRDYVAKYEAGKRNAQPETGETVTETQEQPPLNETTYSSTDSDSDFEYLELVKEEMCAEMKGEVKEVSDKMEEVSMENEKIVEDVRKQFKNVQIQTTMAPRATISDNAASAENKKADSIEVKKKKLIIEKIKPFFEDPADLELIVEKFSPVIENTKLNGNDQRPVELLSSILAGVAKLTEVKGVQEGTMDSAKTD